MYLSEDYNFLKGEILALHNAKGDSTQTLYNALKRTVKSQHKEISK